MFAPRRTSDALDKLPGVGDAGGGPARCAFTLPPTTGSSVSRRAAPPPSPLDTPKLRKKAQDALNADKPGEA